MVRDEQGNPSRSHVRYRLVGGAGRGRGLRHDVCPLNQQPTRLVTAAHRGREAGERGAMTAQIINLAEVRAERERRRALSLFEFWFLFWFRISWWGISPPPVTDRRATAPSGV
jgi:hypothetical protein